ncbi:MAG: TRAP transporter large permease subunit, partial [Polyangiaceae bacterium]
LINYVIQEAIPAKVLGYMLELGLTQTWQFLIVMNIFLLVLGMLMDGFSAILVAVPLILPFAARFTLGPFHLAMIFLLNLEIAYCCPPLGLNLFISSFRFNRPVVSLYRVVLPFAGILTLALILVSYVPFLSDVTIRGDIARARAAAEQNHAPPRESWLMECVQEDTTNPLPCTDADKKRWPNGQEATTEDNTTAPVAEEDAGTGDNAADDALLQMMAGGDGGAATNGDNGGGTSDDDLLKQMENAGKDAGAAAPTPSTSSTAKKSADDLLLEEMMGGKK